VLLLLADDSGDGGGKPNWTSDFCAVDRAVGVGAADDTAVEQLVEQVPKLVEQVLNPSLVGEALENPFRTGVIGGVLEGDLEKFISGRSDKGVWLRISSCDADTADLAVDGGCELETPDRALACAPMFS